MKLQLLTEQVASPELLYIKRHAIPHIFADDEKPNNDPNDLFQNYLESSEHAFEVFENKLKVLVDRYSTNNPPHGLGFDDHGKYTNENIDGRFQVMWTNEYPQDEIMKFAIKYSDLVSHFLPERITYIKAQNVTEYVYPRIYIHKSANIRWVAVLMYDSPRS